MSTLEDYRWVIWCEDCRETSNSTNFEAGMEVCDSCFERSDPEEFAEWVKECEEEEEKNDTNKV